MPMNHRLMRPLSCSVGITFAAPGSPTLTADESGISLSWPAATQYPVDHYIVEYSDDGGATWQETAEQPGTSTSLLVTGLAVGFGSTEYQFRVSAVYLCESPPSDPAALGPGDPGPTVEYLIVGGGGCGGHYCGGGGGGGGLRTGTSATVLGIAYVVTVGAGGATIASSEGAPAGADGSSSSIDSLSGGAGQGGGGVNTFRETGYRQGGGSGTPQSSAGGAGNSGQLWSGGGGGAGAAGTSGESANPDGGVGLAFHGAYYAGGGGGGAGLTVFGSPETPGVGGNGGGGDGGGEDPAAAGAQNSGGGGGGGNDDGNSNSVGGAGGSGVVIIRTEQAAASTTGSPTITTDGSVTVYTFTGSGSITF